VVLLWGRFLASWSLALDKHSGHEDLRDSGHRSVIHYIHGGEVRGRRTRGSIRAYLIKEARTLRGTWQRRSSSQHGDEDLVLT
jgi:hypothetical protein